MNYIAEQQQYIRKLTRDEYRTFINYIDDNYAEMYGNKVSYTVTKDGDNFIVTLSKNTIVDFNDIFA
jgi:uncharacterized membrane protein